MSDDGLDGLGGNLHVPEHGELRRLSQTHGLLRPFARFDDQLVVAFSDARAAGLHVQRQGVVPRRQQAPRLGLHLLAREAQQVDLVGQTDGDQRATRTLGAVHQRWRRLRRPGRLS